MANDNGRLMSVAGGCLGVVLCVPFLIWAPTRWYTEYRFEQEVEGRLKRAAVANTVETATEELDAAIAAIERRGLTQGNTGVFLTEPKNDLGFWYKNLKEASAELHSIPPTLPPGDRANVLKKLRESLTHHGGDQGKESAVAPESASVYPSVGAWVFFGWASCIGLVVGIIVILAVLGINFLE